MRNLLNRNRLLKKIKVFYIILIILSISFNQIYYAKSKQIDDEINRLNYKINDFIFDFKIKTLMRIGSFPSLSICAINNDSVIWSKFYGYSDIYNRISPDKSTTYIIGSVSKAITATAIMQLYEQGLLDLDDDINDYLPFSIRNPKYPDDKITFRMLLSHRSSIYDYHLYTRKGLLEFAYCFPLLTNVRMIVEEFLIPDGIWYHSECWMDYKPGEKTAYSSFGVIILSLLVKEITGLCIEDYCRENIFEPLDMKNTSFHPNLENINRIAVPYLRIFRIYIPLPHYDPKCLCAMGGVHTTVEDLSHFLIALMNNGCYNDYCILNESSITEMCNTIYPEEFFSDMLPNVYGLGLLSNVKFGEKLIGHGGGVPGYLSDMYMTNNSEKGFIMLSNHLLPGSPSSTFAVFRLYPKANIFRIRIGKLVLDRLNNWEKIQNVK